MAMVCRPTRSPRSSAATSRASSRRPTLYEVGFNHFWHAPSDDPRRRPRLHPGPLLAGHLRARVPRGPPDRGAAQALPPGGRRQGPFDGRAVVLPAPVADAGLLAVPDRVDGPRPDHGDLPGALHEVPPGPRHRRTPTGARSGPSSATARRTSPSRSARSRSPAREQPRQPDLRRQLQPAAPGRPGARQRQDHPGARDGLPRRGLERHQGHLGPPLGPAARGRPRGPPRAADERGRRRRVPGLQGPQRRLRARALLRRATPSCARWSPTGPTTEIWALNRGGHDPYKVFAAYAAAVAHDGPPDRDPRQDDQGLRDGRGRRGPEHHPPAEEDDERRRCSRSATASSCRSPTSRSPRARSTSRPTTAPRCTTCTSAARRSAATCPSAAATAEPLEVPPLEAFDAQLKGTGDREVSTTMAFVRILNTLVRDKQIGRHVVPIVPDESRTFGMEGMFRQLGIFSQLGQLYQPEDREQLMFYKEDKKGQILQEGINEAGAFSSWIAAATAYATTASRCCPFYIFYSMFGFQRIGDLAWAAGRQPRARVPPRRHRRPDDAERRGPPARGRPQPRAGRDDPELPRLRPDLRLRARRDHPGRPAAHGARSRRTSSTT